MSCYIVAFEVATEAARKRLVERMKAYGHYCPINKNCWAIVAENKASEIRDNLSQVLMPTDRLFVIRSGTEGAWRNAYSQKNTDWLKRYL